MVAGKRHMVWRMIISARHQKKPAMLKKSRRLVYFFYICLIGPRDCKTSAGNETCLNIDH